MAELKLKWNDTAPANMRSVFDACIRCLAHAHSSGRLSLLVPGDRPGHQTTRHLAGRNSPKGEIVCDHEKGQLVAFKALDLLAWMTANKFCSMVA